VRFSLQDVKKSIHRRGGTLCVSLHFLRESELQQEIAHLIAYFEQMLGQPRRLFSLDEVRNFIGDYRLAQCLNSTLSYWYTWQNREWAGVLQERAPGATAAHLLQEAGITTPSQLRLALYTWVNEQYQGFLDTPQRQAALTTFAAQYSLQAADLEYLLEMDSEDEGLLIRTAPTPPTVQEVITLYNQWAFEAALLQASSVRFVIDYAAFARSDGDTATPFVRTGVGTVIKRLCYLARKLGVYYDLAYEDAEPETHHLLLTLYGPQDVTGVAQQYGLRLSRLCRLLLGHRTRSSKRGQRDTLSTAIVSADATIHFLQRTYTLTLDAHLLRFLHALPAEHEQQTASSEASGNALFDSSIEQAFAEAFAALTQGQGTRGVHGWQLEREPEPLLLTQNQAIFIPDFAFTRSSYRIYVEILGFWTPSYRERKLAKLQALQARQDIALAIPLEAKDAFSSIASHFPIIYYNGQLSATEMITLLDNRYNDFAERLARLDVAAIRAQVQQHGLLSERACYDVLHCYRRSELQQMAERIVDVETVFVAGIGLYATSWMQQLEAHIKAWLEQQQAQHAVSLALPTVLQEMRNRYEILMTCEDAALETILSSWPGLQLQRDSIFEATVQVLHEKFADEVQPIPDAEIKQNRAPLEASGKSVSKRIRERRVPLQKRTGSEMPRQDDLWGNTE
jgi:predicted nuclease of restriction endonuclease-like RecB superfamily